MKRIVLLVVLLVHSIAFGAAVPGVCHNELSAWIKAGKAVAIVDIQEDSEYRAHNYENSIATGNDPSRLKKIARRLRTSKEKVILVSTTGGEDAARAAELLAGAGIKRSRLLILEGGMETAAKNASCDCCKPASLKGDAQ